MMVSVVPFNFKYRDKEGNPFGLFLSRGQVWRDLRRFTQQAFRDLGVGKRNVMESIIMEVRRL